jgi:2-keto-4-pentenoate hydratase/2-oxohepta-3-ene-1,7-dioic acid hydratase in catechol pathway
MRLVTFHNGMTSCLGLVQEDQVIDLSMLAQGAYPPLPATMLEFIAAGAPALGLVRRLLDDVPRDAVQPLADARLLAPIPRPSKNIFCVGMNYLAHAHESARARGKEYEPLAHPAFFTKAPTAVIGPYDPIPFPTGITEQVDWEVELAVVIGTRGKNLTPETALEHVFGYRVLNDVSARDIQNHHGGQFFRGKSLDGFCPMGPWIVTADEVPDPQDLRLMTRVNGDIRQDSTTADMIFPLAQVLAELSAGLTLEPGDIIATGTPSGVGMGRTPPVWLRPGDVVETEVVGLGMLRNEVIE